jgi:hypothetical protein
MGNTGERDPLSARGDVDQPAQFLAKPYSVHELSRRVREPLDARLT